MWLFTCLSWHHLVKRRFFPYKWSRQRPTDIYMSLASDYEVYYIDLHVLIQRLCYLCLEKLAAVSPVSYPAFKITGVTQSPLQYHMNFRTHIFFHFCNKSVLARFNCHLDTANSHSGRGGLKWGISQIRLACDHVCGGGLSWWLMWEEPAHCGRCHP